MEKYFKFKGSAGRSEYWGVNLIGFLLAAVGYMVAFIIMTLGTPGMVFGILIALAVMLGYFWLWISTSIRRTRDAGINPFWTAAVVIPYIGFIVWIVIGLLPTKGLENGNT